MKYCSLLLFVLSFATPLNALTWAEFWEPFVEGSHYHSRIRNRTQTCYKIVRWEEYIPGDSVSPGYVKSFNEKVSIPCNSHGKVFNHYNHKVKPQTSYVKYDPAPKCTGNTTLGGLIGGGIAASLSKRDAYSWSIPLGAVLGAGIGNAGCK